MKPIRRILRNRVVQRALCWIAALYVRLVHATTRWTVRGAEIPRDLVDRGLPFIVCFWHGRLLMMPYAWPSGAPFMMLISSHPDGRLISGLIRQFGLGTIVGSSTRGGAAALRDIVRTLKAGHAVGFTPDGPRGPRMRASSGVVAAARIAGVPIVPVTVATSNRRVLQSWDRFIVNLPFGRGAFLWGEPIHVDQNANDDAVERIRREVEERLNALTAEADRLCGQTPPAPAPDPTAGQRATADAGSPP